MCIKRQTVWHFRRPNVNALKPQKGGKIYKRRGVNKAVFWTTSESLQTVVFSSYRCSSQPPRTVCCPSN